MNKIETPKTLEELFQALRAIRVEINTAKSADFLTGKKQQSFVTDLTTCMKGLSNIKDSEVSVQKQMPAIASGSVKPSAPSPTAIDKTQIAQIMTVLDERMPKWDVYSKKTEKYFQELDESMQAIADSLKKGQEGQSHQLEDRVQQMEEHILSQLEERIATRLEERMLPIGQQLQQNGEELSQLKNDITSLGAKLDAIQSKEDAVQTVANIMEQLQQLSKTVTDVLHRVSQTSTVSVNNKAPVASPEKLMGPSSAQEKQVDKSVRHLEEKSKEVAESQDTQEPHPAPAAQPMAVKLDKKQQAFVDAYNKAESIYKIPGIEKLKLADELDALFTEESIEDYIIQQKPDQMTLQKTGGVCTYIGQMQQGNVYVIAPMLIKGKFFPTGDKLYRSGYTVLFDMDEPLETNVQYRYILEKPAVFEKKGDEFVFSEKGQLHIEVQ